MGKFSRHKWWFVTLILSVPAIALAQSLTTFTAGTVIKSADVNANFTALSTSITALTTRVAALEARAPSKVTQLNFTGPLSATGTVRQFTSIVGGGDVVIMVSGTAYTSTTPTLALAVSLNGAALAPQITLVTNELNSHKTLPTMAFRVAAPAAAGPHNLTIEAGNAATTTDANDRFNITVLQFDH